MLAEGIHISPKASFNVDSQGIEMIIEKQLYNIGLDWESSLQLIPVGQQMFY